MGNCCAAPSRRSAFFSRTRNLRSLSSITSEDVDEEEGRGSEVLSPVSVLGDGASTGEDLQRRYRLGEELGRGEFGVTRRCEDAETGEVVACKSISKRKLRTAVDVEDVRREVEIMRALPPHPHIVRFRDAFEDADALFDRIVAKGHFSEHGAASIVKTIVEVVQHCHRHGVTHRDLKPENFLFVNKTETSPLKAIDFGLSVCFEPGERFNDIVGSAFYMAPEVLRRNYGPEADVWSAGSSSTSCYEGIAYSIVRSVYSFEREPWPRISEDAKDLVIHMLDSDPYTRLTAGEVLEHPWIQNAATGPNACLGEAIQSFHKLKQSASRKLREDLKNIGGPIPDPEAWMLVEAVDEDGGGRPDCEELVIASTSTTTDLHLMKAFSYFDRNSGGFVEIDKLRDALGENNELVLKYHRLCGQDKEIRISYEELKMRIMMLMARSEEDRRLLALGRYSTAVKNTLSFRLFDNGCSER
ncbi:unnamed protein product [Spirodela intermedia]|uniref:Uncharacterized protein n=1 Tax=Spirodela intermedia TaxID=51605 RepID=A0A7I8JFI4_SPIIN|nr:unnamed protein product [Spirodela intermedia]CAA6668293.1 unnamed protein product [Spirodela intermedia]